MPVAAARVKQLSPFVIHDVATFTTPPFPASAFAGRPTSRSTAGDSFQILVVHFRHFSGYVWPENNRPRLRIHASLAKKNVGGNGATFARDFGS